MSLNIENYFILFGLSQTFFQDKSKIKVRYHQLQKNIHPDNFVNSTPQEKMLAVQYAATVNQAYQTLCCPLKRGIYLLKLEGIDAQNETDNAMPMEFLVEQMELREQLALAFENHSEKEMSALTLQIETAIDDCQQNFANAFNNHPKQLSEAKMCIKKMQFYTRIHEEILSFA